MKKLFRFSKTIIIGSGIALLLLAAGCNQPTQSTNSFANQPTTPKVESAQITNQNSAPTITGTKTEQTEPALTIPQTKNTAPDDNLSNNNYYTNSAGNSVHAPAYDEQPNTTPAGATARCSDGTFSFSQSHRGTCSHHGGVAEWLD